MKDQSYFLYSLDSDRLRRIRFPVGEMMKEQVRKLALGAGLPVYEKRESQDICFVTDHSYTRFLESRGISEDQGRFVDREGNFLGNHKGVLRYTVGQRKGLGIASKEPLYVVAIDAAKNEIVLGNDGETFSGEATVISRPSSPALPGGRSSERPPGCGTTNRGVVRGEGETGTGSRSPSTRQPAA